MINDGLFVDRCTMNIAIRPAEFEDIEALIALLNQLFSIEHDFLFDEDKQRKGLELMLTSDGRCILVAEHQAAATTV